MSTLFKVDEIVQCKLDLTTDSAGAASVTSEDKYLGMLYAVQLIDGDLADGVDLTLTCEQGDLSIPLLTIADFNTDQMQYPRVLETLNTAGSALTTHTRPIVNGYLKAVLAQGGDVKTGAVIVYITGQ